MRSLRALSSGFTWAGMVLLAAATAILFMNVLFRYLLSRPFSWSDELTVLMQMWFVFLPQAWLELRDEHLRLTILTSRITRPWAIRILRLAQSAVIVGINLYMAYYGVRVVLETYRFQSRTYTLEIPFWIIYAVLPVSLFAVALVRLLDPLYRGEGKPC